ncbi:MAG: nitrate ABC transporter ATP-binding protein [Chelatococcus sp.]|nr:MAG: nitrate ABC transporter ATP-binding protein [Chelatococcus sp.]
MPIETNVPPASSTASPHPEERSPEGSRLEGCSSSQGRPLEHPSRRPFGPPQDEGSERKDEGSRAKNAGVASEGVGLAGVSYAAGGTRILSDVDLAVPQGGFHVLVGRSGCGKTTLLKLAAGLLRPTAGTVSVAGHRLDGPGAEIGFVFQAPTLLEWLAAEDNVLLPISLERRVMPADREKARALLARLGLAGLSKRYPDQLSGGQQARVAIARALVTGPRLLLLDEPFAALDALTREELQADLARLSLESGATVMLVTHDIAEAAYLADEIAVMGTGVIAERFTVGMPRIRPPGIRYEPAFNGLCRDVRAALDRSP